MRWARVCSTSAGACALGAAVLASGARQASAPVSSPPAASDPLPVALREAPAFPLASHVESTDIAAGEYPFERLFAVGDVLFHAAFNGLDGVGSSVRKDGSRVPRFAPPGPRGPGSQGCGECHAVPFPASAGLAHSSVARDKKGTTEVNVRSVTSLFGDGILQLLAQEMTEELQATREAAAAAAKTTPGTAVSRELMSKGTSFGAITATAQPDGQVQLDTAKLAGIDPDLVVRPMGWKGDAPMVRNITLGAAAGGMGMIGDEIVWKKAGAGKYPDVDGDGVERELSVGDITAMTIYTAAQETPAELGRLAALGYVQAPSSEDAARVEAGRQTFAAIGCASCHTPEMPLANTRFEEPTMRGNGHYYDAALAALDPGYDPKRPVVFDILNDAQPPRAEPRPDGGAVIRLYGDLKRHAMGRVLADPAGPSESTGPDLEPLKYNGSPVMIPADQFLTRAGTLREAILLHGEDTPVPVGAPGRSEAQEARDGFAKASAADQEAVIAFLLSLRTFSPGKP